MRPFVIVYILYKAPRDLPICVQRLREHPYGTYITEVYGSVQRVYKNTARVRVIYFLRCNAIRVFAIGHLLYEVPRDLPLCVQSLRGHPYGNISQPAVQIPTACVPQSG